MYTNYRKSRRLSCFMLEASLCSNFSLALLLSSSALAFAAITAGWSLFLADVNLRSSSLCAIGRPFVVCLSSVVCDVGAPYSGGWTFQQFFSPYDSAGTLLFWCQKSLWGTPFFPWNLRSKWPTPFQTAKFRLISAHSASTVIASEKSSISTYRKSTTRFPTSYR